MATDFPPRHELDPAVKLRRQRESARRQVRSRRIQFWRKALPLVIAGVAGLLVLWIGGRSLIVKLSSSSGTSNSGVRMVNPRFYGRDSSNRAYVLGASEASRDLKNGKTVTLAGPQVTLDADGTSPTHVQAKRGVYREDQRKLSLEGEVRLTQSGGFSFSTPSAVVDTTSGLVSGQAGVKGDGPLGRIAASSYGVYDRGRRIVLKGDVRSHIVQ
jgi:lipopolysaccharide export system protein LptC